MFREAIIEEALAPGQERSGFWAMVAMNLGAELGTVGRFDEARVLNEAAAAVFRRDGEGARGVLARAQLLRGDLELAAGDGKAIAFRTPEADGRLPARTSFPPSNRFFIGQGGRRRTTMGISQYDPAARGRPAWNPGKQVGVKRALKPRQIWAIRFYQQHFHQRDK